MSRPTPPIDLTRDELRLALSIAEGPSLKVSGQKLQGGGSASFQRLCDRGALVHKERATTIICRECDRGHRATLDFDRERQATTYFCREAGRVTVEPTLLDVYEFQLNCLLGWIAEALCIAAKQRPIPWVEEHLWELGETKIHHQRLRVMFARGISPPDRVAEIESITARRTDKTGVIFAASSRYTVPRRLNGFSIVSLDQVLAADQSRAAIDPDRLLAIAELEATIDPYRSGLPTRRSGAHFVDKEHERRIAERKAKVSIGEEARELADWYAENHSDGPPLTVRTIENRIRELHNQYKAGIRCTS